jgi:RsiW-degrading membrane proteinase PrsW (M82 family)
MVAQVVGPLAPRQPAAFCTGCGTPASGLRFCSWCGQPSAATGAAGGWAPVAPPPPPPASLRLSVLVPLGDWWRFGLWRDRRLVGFAAVALVPFLLLHLAMSGSSFGVAAWGFSIYFAVLWSIAIHALVRPERVSVGMLAAVVGTTAVVGVAAAILLEGHLGASADSLLGSIATIGFPEELAKALPLLFVLWRLGAAGRPRTYLYLGAISGIAFGAVEAVGYSAMYTDAMDEGSDPSVVVGVIWRLLTDSLFHGAMAGICGLFIGLAALQRSQRWVLVAAGMTFSAVLHGAYDRFAGGVGGLLLAAVTIVLFAGYLRSSEEIVKRM